jgi:hypothetical protein
MGDGNGEAGRSGSSAGEKNRGRKGEERAGKGGVTRKRGRGAPRGRRHAMHDARQPHGRENGQHIRTSDFSREIRHISPGDPVRFCMPSGDPGVGIG